MPEEGNKESSMSRVSITIAVLALLIAVVACVLVVLVWARPELISPSASATDNEALAQRSASAATSKVQTMVDSIKAEMEKQAMAQMQKTYTFAYGYGWPPMEYLDSQGFMKGLNMDLAKEACEVAGKNCSHVLNYNVGDCWDTYNRAGNGLNGGWITACIGWYPTPERMNVYEFVGSLYAPEQAALYVRPRSGVTSVIGRKVGFREGWNTDAACLGRNGLAVTEDNRVLGDSFTELKNKLNNSEVDLIFAPMNTFSDLVALGTKYTCVLGNAGLMMRKEMKSSMMWFHEAVESMKTSGKFGEICSNAMRNHGKAGLCVTA